MSGRGPRSYVLARRSEGVLPSPEWWLVEGAQLSGMQARALLAEQPAGGHANLEVGGDGFLIEFVRLPRQLDRAMQLLVADA